MKNTFFLAILILLLNGCSNNHQVENLKFLKLICAPGAITCNSVTIVWPDQDPLPEGQKYSIIQDGNSIGETSKTFFRIEGLAADSLYQFEVSIIGNKGMIGTSNSIRARTKAESKVFNISSFGAIGDGITLNTEAIQLAIDSCGHNGTVIVPKGNFVTGALFAKSNMTLFLEKGATLRGSKNKEDYPVVRSRYEGLETDAYASLINGGELCGKGIQNFTLRGEGTINGEGETLYLLQKPKDVIRRGRLVSIINGENIYLEGVQIINSPSRAVHLIYSNGISVEHVTINTSFNTETGERYKVTNSDGLTLGSSKNAYIFGSKLSSQDDGISLKSGRNEEGRLVGKSTEHIRIFEMEFHRGLGVVCGSEMSGGIRDILVNNCTFKNTALVAQLKAPWGRGATIENITYKNLVHSDTIYGDNKWFRGAICIDQYYGADEPDFSQEYPMDERMPLIRDVWFENITVSREKGKAIYLCGRPDMHLKNINLKNVHAKAPHGFYGLFIDQLNLENVTVENEAGESYIWKDVNALNQN